jgi:hypothetical protein
MEETAVAEAFIGSARLGKGGKLGEEIAFVKIWKLRDKIKRAHFLSSHEV